MITKIHIMITYQNDLITYMLTNAQKNVNIITRRSGYVYGDFENNRRWT